MKQEDYRGEHKTPVRGDGGWTRGHRRGMKSARVLDFLSLFFKMEAMGFAGGLVSCVRER